MLCKWMSLHNVRNNKSWQYVFSNKNPKNGSSFVFKLFACSYSSDPSNNVIGMLAISVL